MSYIIKRLYQINIILILLYALWLIIVIIIQINPKIVCTEYGVIPKEPPKYINPMKPLNFEKSVCTHSEFRLFNQQVE